MVLLKKILTSTSYRTRSMFLRCGCRVLARHVTVGRMPLIVLLVTRMNTVHLMVRLVFRRIRVLRRLVTSV